MSEEIRVTASVGGRPLTLDPIRTLPLDIPLREVESLIPAGFQQVWGSGETADGEEFQIACGAGWGSRWLTIKYKGKSYCFAAEDLFTAFLAALEVTDGADG